MSSNVKKQIRFHILIIPILIVLGSVIVIPELWAIVLSFTEYEPGQPLVFCGLKNFVQIWRDNYFWNALKNNLIFVIGAVSLQILIGLAFSLLLARGFPGQKIWISLILAPYAVSPAVAAPIWKYMLNSDVGILNYLLSRVGVESISWLADPTWAWVSVFMMYTWGHVPFTFVILYPTIISIPSMYREAAMIDGANWWQIFTNVTLSFIKPTIVVILTFRIIIAFRVFGEIWLLTGGGPFRKTEVLAIYLYKQGFVYWQWGMAAGVGLVILVFTMLAALPQIRTLYQQMFGKE